MWAYGKSATDYYAKSVIQTAGWKFCNDNKESFRWGTIKGHTFPQLNVESLRACLERGELFAHVKPEHIKHGDPALATPDGFFSAAKEAGWSVVVALHRENGLSRQLSGINWGLRHQTDPRMRELAFVKYFCDRGDNILEQYAPERQMIIRGMQAALRAGFRVLFLTYADVTADTCGSVGDTLAFYDPTKEWPHCTLDLNNSHAKTHVDLPLREHLGDHAAACANDTFSKHPEWRWMLDEGGHRSLPPLDWPAVDYNISHPNFIHRTDLHPTFS